MNKKSSSIYKQIIEYTPTASESEREANRQKELNAKCAELSELVKEGNAILRGVDIDRFVGRNFRDADRYDEIKRKIHATKNDIRALSIIPIQDDAYHVLCEELDNVTAQRIEAEKRYDNAVSERELSMGRIPFDMFQSLTREMYDLAAEVEKLREQEKDLTARKAQYNRRSDSLYAEYMQLKDAEVKTFVLEHVRAMVEYLTAAEEERDSAETMTYARKGQTVPVLPVPFGGDVVRQILHYCEELIAVCKE